MKKTLSTLLLLCLLALNAFCQTKFSDETKKFIEYNNNTIVLKNALLIDGKGLSAKPGQTIIISHGKIEWMENAGE